MSIQDQFDDSELLDYDYGRRNGTITYPNGNIYTGELSKIKEEDDDGDYPDGYGIMRYANGDVYEGDGYTSQSGEFSKYGNGIMRYANRDMFEGEWKESMTNGIMRYANGDIYEGEWSNIHNDDKIEDDPTDMEKQLSIDTKYGNGIMRYANGDVYQGKWRFDKKDGNGIMQYANGDVFEGEWQNDLIHGNNEYMFPKYQQSFKHIPSNVQLYDPIMMEEENLHKYLKTKDNLVFIFGNNYFPLNKDTIRMQIKDPLNIVFECFTSGTLKPDNINKKVKYLRLNSLGIPGDFIQLTRMRIILLDKQQIYNMVATDKVLVTVVSDSVLNRAGSHVGASHCQDGQGGKVYDLNKKIIRAYSNRTRKNILSITKKKKGYFSKSKSSKIKSSLLKKKSNSKSKKSKSK